tara:strand:+ start:149 stop:3604 length:3456 start_codon:yes stop_codon:yes gene_type:complete
MAVLNNTGIRAGASAAGGGDYQITKSLRFDPGDTAHLTETPSSAGNRKQWTWSGWIKRADFPSYQNIFAAGENIFDGGSGGAHATLCFDSSQHLQMYDYEGSYGYQITTNAFYRDCSAWMHIVGVLDTPNSTANDRVRLYVNGERVTDFSVNTMPSQDAEETVNSTAAHYLGLNNGDTLNGYMADVHFIDGQALDASSFGKTNADTGEWIPKKYAGSYGTNGFHFKFTGTDLGEDSSGNDNDWDANNLLQSVTTISSPNLPSWSTADSGWSLSNSDKDATYSSSGYAHVITGALTDSTTYHFYLSRKDGSDNYGGWFFSDTTSPSNTVPDELGGNSLGARMGESGGGAWGTYATANGVTAGQNAFSGWTSISSRIQVIEFVVNRTVDKVWMRAAGAAAWLGGGDPTNTSSTASFLLPDGDTIYFGCVDYGTGGYANFRSQYGEANDVDATNDSPTTFDDEGNGTGNYCTWNSVFAQTSYSNTLSQGNLKVTGTGDRPATMRFGSGKWYWEMTFNSGTLGQGYCGIVDINNTADRGWGTNAIAAARDSGYGLYGDSSTGSSPASWSAGDVISFAVDVDNQKFFIGVNGTWTNSGNPASGTGASFTGRDFSNYTPLFSDNNSDATYTANFGQRTFKYTPPSGFKSLNTYNMPDPVIADPSKHFDASVYTGAGSSVDVSTNFSPDLVWVKSRLSTASHNIIDKVRGDDNYLMSNSTAAEDDSYADVLELKSDGYTVGSNNSAFSGTNGNIGWAWDAGEANTSVSADGLNSTVYNKSSTWSGSNNASTGPVKTESGSYYSGGYDAKWLFDGRSSYMVMSTSAGHWIEWTPADSAASDGGAEEDFTFTDTVEVELYDATNSVNFTITYSDDTTSTTEVSSTGWTTIATGGGVLKKLKAESTNTSSGWNYWSGVKIDGKQLVDDDQSVEPTIPTIASTYRANPSAGFSIVTYEGDGSNGTVAHGLNATPNLIIIKNRDSATSWPVYHSDIGIGSYGVLEDTSAWDTGSATYIFNTAPTSNVFGIGTGTWVNTDGTEYVAYCWSEVEGYSKFGSYTGNGNDDGPFVWCGFRPRWLLIKNSATSADWQLYDTTRETENVMNTILSPASTAAESSAEGYKIDLLSNGFKPRYNYAGHNGSGNTLVFAAFAESPFKYANAR